MRYYPAYLDIQNRKCLVVGGGRVATRKVLVLLDCGAVVTVISPRVTDQLQELITENRVHYIRRPYTDEDLADVFMVIGATDDQALNRRIHWDAEQKGRLCNIADQPGLCNFILPSIINRGDLTIAVSTGGKSPAFAKYLRHRLQDQFGPEYAEFLTLMGVIRDRLLAEDHAPEAHKNLFEQLISQGLLEKIRLGNNKAINSLLLAVLGPGFEYDQLMNDG
jgi:precorrin-2 dehydrogenase/sirohydrochlorin ferrochelatase